MVWKHFQSNSKAQMRLSWGFALCLLLLTCSLAGAKDRLRMSTTTSTENAGLLNVLLPPFEKRCNCKVDDHHPPVAAE
jgi:tungstate transport system substrate-binding protein